MMMETSVKKKRGRKPKNYYNENVVEEQPQAEKKKRGRKKKYEIENSDKILNRNDEDNFDHNIIYSDDEFKETEITEKNKFVKKVAFGNLNITVSKKNTEEQCNYRNTIFEKTKQSQVVINENEWESDEEKEIPIENILNLNQENFERYYKENKKYVPSSVSQTNDRNDSLKRMRVVSCLKNVVSETEWPEKCDVCCLWCCHTFENSPCTLPTKYDSLRKRFTYVGIFCSWNCVRSYNLERNDHKKYERNGLITFLIQQLYGIVKAINVKPAPPRQTLKIFGGYLSIDEFRNNNFVDSYRLNLYNFNYIFPEVTEITNVKFKNENKPLRLTRKES
jgi:hypothetical protein